MKIVDEMGLFALACKAQTMWGLYLSFPEVWEDPKITEEFKKACLFYDKLGTVSMDGKAYLFFESETEMWDHYYSVVGEDGPTKMNPYNGDFKIFALTCDPQGNMLTENT